VATGFTWLGARDSIHGQRDLAADQRLWQRRADTYVELLAWCDENTHVSRHEGNIPHDLIQLPYLLRGRVSAFGSLAVLDATNRIVDLQTGRLLLAEFFPDADNSVVTTLLWVSHLQELIHGELQGVSPRAPQSPASP
jgi:hypothetical protein